MKLELNHCKEIYVFDDLNIREDVNRIYTDIMNNEFAWYYNAKTIYKEESKKIQYSHKEYGDYDLMIHTFIKNHKPNSHHINVPLKLLDLFCGKTGLNYSAIARVQANFVWKRNCNPSPPHTDSDKKHYVLLAYLNDSDGETVLFNDDLSVRQKITPKQGRIVLFDGSILHSAGVPKETIHRIVFNYNLVI